MSDMDRRKFLSGLAGVLGMAGTAAVIAAERGPELSKPLGEIGATRINVGAHLFERENDDAMIQKILRRQQEHRVSGVNYAKAGETPNWENQRVIDCDTDLELDRDCSEVDCVTGWATVWCRPRTSMGFETVHGRFRLENIE